MTAVQSAGVVRTTAESRAVVSSAASIKSDNRPVLERELNPEELKAELLSVGKTRKIIMGAVWTIAVAVMIYGMVNVTPFLIDHGVNPWIAPGLPLMVDIALAVSLWGDKMMRRYDMKDGWITTLRWGTALITWALNIAHPLSITTGQKWTPDWVGILVHSCGPIMLILVTEAANSFSRKTTMIVQTLAKAEEDEKIISDERVSMLRDMEAELATKTEEVTTLRGQVEAISSGTGGVQVQLEQVTAGSNRLLELLTLANGSVETDVLLGQSLIQQFGSHGHAQTILLDDQTTHNEKSDIWGRRIIVCRAGTDTLVLADKNHPKVAEALEGAESLSAGVSRIPSAQLVPIRDSDLGHELVVMLRERGVLSNPERLQVIDSIKEGTCSALENGLLSRVIVRAALDTNKLESRYRKV